MTSATPLRSPALDSNRAYNADQAEARGLSMGFQRTLPGKPQVPRNYVKVTFSATIQGSASSGSPATATFQPVSISGMHNFRPGAVTACLDMAIVDRASGVPVQVRLDTYQRNTVLASRQDGVSAASQVPSFGQDNVIGCVPTASGGASCNFNPSPDAAGAQVEASNVFGHPIRLVLTDLASGTMPVTDVLKFWVSIVFFERAPL